jgi:PIN domain nuclease of toxin-antitoxin system
MRTILLDTGMFLWLAFASHRLPEAVRAALRSGAHDWRVHQVSFWEIQVKHDLGKLPMPAPPAELIPRIMKRTGLTEAPLSTEAIFFLGKLPSIHRDPFDRMLLAHAMHFGWEIATSDRTFARYPVRLFA